LTELHLLLAYAAAVAGAVILLTALAGMVAGPPLRVWLDRSILAALAALLLAALTGLPLVLLTGPPADPLHLVYAAAAPLVLLTGRYLGRRGSLRRRALLVAIAGVALLGVIYRLFTTGGPAS
jgi:hypothetical protein